MSSKEVKRKRKTDKEDNRLAEWKTHLERTKNFEKKVYNTQKRDVNDFMLNSGDNVRSDIEEKMILDYARIPQVDKYRGKPSFFPPPPILPRHPSLQPIPKKQENYEIPNIEYVAVPNAIKKEKHILTDDSTKKSNLKRQNSYKVRRFRELEKDIKRIQTHKPEMEELVIVGNKISRETEKRPSAPSPSEDDTEEENMYKYNDFSIRNPPLAGIQIDDKKILSNEKNQKPQYHYISVDSTTLETNIITQSLTITNIGNVSLRYFWKRVIEKNVLEDIIPYRPPPASFIFNKNESIILPGLTETLDIHFQVKKSGVFEELWELCTMPSVFTAGKFVLTLWANVGLADDILQSIEDRINAQMTNAIVESTISDMLKGVKLTEEDLSDSEEIVKEKDLFEVMNSDFTVPSRAPLICHYNEDLVKQLKILYEKVKSSNDPKNWSYKLTDLEKVIRNGIDSEELPGNLLIYNDIVSQLSKSRTVENVEDYKYEKVYKFLCIMFDKMTSKVYDIRVKFQLYRPERYPEITEVKENNESIEDLEEEEAFEKTPIKPHENEQEAMLALKDIPKDDISLKFNSYYKEKYGKTFKEGSSELQESKTKKGKSTAKDKEDKKKNKGKTKEKSSPGLSKLNNNGSIGTRSSIAISSSELYTPDFISDKSMITADFVEDLSPNSLKLYKQNLYSAIYALLSETVSEIELLLRFQVDKSINRNILRKCIELGVPTSAPNPNFKYESISKTDFQISDDDLSLSDSSEDIESLSNLLSSYSTSNLKLVTSQESSVTQISTDREKESKEIVAENTTVNKKEISSDEVKSTTDTTNKNVNGDRDPKITDDNTIDVVEFLKKELNIGNLDEYTEENFDSNTELKTDSCSGNFFY